MRVYKILSSEEWEAASRASRYLGSDDDLRDGFIHLSTGAQAAETYRRHFLGRRGLVILAVNADRLGEALRWEPSRNGELFPHLYGALDAEVAEDVRPLDDPLGA